MVQSAIKSFLMLSAVRHSAKEQPRWFKRHGRRWAEVIRTNARVQMLPRHTSEMLTASLNVLLQPRAATLLVTFQEMNLTPITDKLQSESRATSISAKRSSKIGAFQKTPTPQLEKQKSKPSWKWWDTNWLFSQMATRRSLPWETCIVHLTKITTEQSASTNLQAFSRNLKSLPTTEQQWLCSSALTSTTPAP